MTATVFDIEIHDHIPINVLEKSDENENENIYKKLDKNICNCLSFFFVFLCILVILWYIFDFL